MKRINVLIFTDIHYIGKANHVCSIEGRKAEPGLEFVEKALNVRDYNIATHAL
ncbi:MAG: hypothetical protein GX094_10700 [Clostridiales bacterium]|jgi:hypothetical protein|nr:hypothetical protein [Clostridiales bacterium]